MRRRPKLDAKFLALLLVAGPASVITPILAPAQSAVPVAAAPADGVIKHAGVLAVGGDHITNDLAYGLKVSQSRAESLKRSHGAAVTGEPAENDVIQLTSDHGLPVKTVSRVNLLRIMSMRVEEIFELIAEELEQLGLLNYLRAGVFVLLRSSAGRCQRCRQ